MDILLVAVTCAPLISPIILAGVVDVASSVNPLAIYITGKGESIHPKSEGEAADIARRLLRDGVQFKAGLAQIDSAQWGELKLTPENVFVACPNLSAAEQLLIEAYRLDVGDLDAALSRFGTGGDPQKGIKNGYVAAVRAAGEKYGAQGRSDRSATSTAAQEPVARDNGFGAVPDGFAAGDSRGR
jgi:hypothetical protein